MKAILILALFTLHQANAMEEYAQQQRNKQLYEAVTWGNYGNARLALVFGANVNHQERTGTQLTPLHAAAITGNQKISILLMKKGANLNAVDTAGNTPLMRAVKNKQSQIYKLFLQAGAETAIANKQGKTALMLAQEYGNEEAIKDLSLPTPPRLRRTGELGTNGTVTRKSE